MICKFCKTKAYLWVYYPDYSTRHAVCLNCYDKAYMYYGGIGDKLTPENIINYLNELYATREHSAFIK